MEEDLGIRNRLETSKSDTSNVMKTEDELDSLSSQLHQEMDNVQKADPTQTIGEQGDAIQTTTPVIQIEGKPVRSYTSLADYFWSELSRGYAPQSNSDSYTVRQDRVTNFLQIPKETEKLMFYGLLVCIDSFLFLFTFLPLRMMIILFHIITRPTILLNPWRSLTVFQRCDIVKAFLILIGALLMELVDVSMIYHIIRGQATIKLYIFFGLLEVGDRLLSSIGQDMYSTLMWSIADSNNQSIIQIMFKFISAATYVLLHSMLVLLQATTLNVAFNSHNKSLLTIMISNNAVEVKGCVYKRFDKTSLFQLACSDIRERFHLLFLTFIVIMRNMADSNWNLAQLESLYPDIILLFVSEIGVDITKHAFVTKFNSIRPEMFQLYKCILAKDVLDTHKNETYTDASDQISRRVGLCSIPVACLLIKVVIHSVKINTIMCVINALLVFVCILLFKVILGLIIHARAVKYITEYKNSHPDTQTSTSDKEIDEELETAENNLHWKPRK